MLNGFIPLINSKFRVPEETRDVGYCSRAGVISIGGGRDYVGSCINIASRLQKLSDLTFCFFKRKGSEES